MDTRAKNSFSDENQRAVIMFLYFQKHTAAEIHRQLVQVLGKTALSKRSVRLWCQRFKEGNYDVKESRSRPYISDDIIQERIDKLEEAFDETRAWSLRALSAKTGLSRPMCHRIITENLKMKKILAKWVPRELSPSQLETRVVYCKDNLRNYNQQQSRLSHTVAIDETWVSLYRPPEKDQSKQWLRRGEKPKSMAVPDRFGSKVMIILAMDIRGICYYEILNQNEKIGFARYLEFLKRLMEKWHGNQQHTVWILDDNARPHRHASVTQWIEDNNIERWLQPPYSPDLSPCDYGCFHALKRAIGGVHYQNIGSLKQAIDNEISRGNANERYLAVQRLPERWLLCVNNKGEFL